MLNTTANGQSKTFTKNETFGGMTTGINRGKDYDSVLSYACGRDFVPVILTKELSVALAPYVEALNAFKSFARFTGVSTYENQEDGTVILKHFHAKAFDVYDTTTRTNNIGWKAGFVGRGGEGWMGDSAATDILEVCHS